MQKYAPLGKWWDSDLCVAWFCHLTYSNHVNRHCRAVHLWIWIGFYNFHVNKLGSSLSEDKFLELVLEKYLLTSRPDIPDIAILLLQFTASQMLQFVNLNIGVVPHSFFFTSKKVFPHHCYFTVCLRTTLSNADFREFAYVPGFNITRKRYGIFTCVNIDLATKQILACLNSPGIVI